MKTVFQHTRIALFVSLVLLTGCLPEPAETNGTVVTQEGTSSLETASEDSTTVKQKELNAPDETDSKTETPKTPDVNHPKSEPEDAAKVPPPAALALEMVMWNVESEGADAKVIAKQLGELKKYDVFALSEVLPKDLKLFREAVGMNYRYLYSRSGFNDRLQLLYNTNKFELVREMELNEINHLGRYRSPIVIHLKDKSTQVEFLVMNNHLARGKAEIRTQQAEQLVEWARNQTLPVIALGDYNFDFVFATESGNDGFRAMLRDNIWKWVRPAELIDTNWYDQAGDGTDDYPGSMLDFAFVAGPAKDWETVCNVIVRPGDFPDDEKTSDHRPAELLITRPAQ